MSWDEEDWESKEISFKPEAPKNNWDDEDVEEEEPTPAPATSEDKTYQAPAVVKPKKAQKEILKKAQEKLEAQKKAPKMADETLADPVAEKLRRQKLVEEADHQLTEELFAGVKKPKEESDSLDACELSSAADVEEFAKQVSKKLLESEGAHNAAKFLIQCVKSASTNMTSQEVKDLSAAVNVVLNDKVKSEKDNKKGKKKSTKAAVSVSARGALADYDDYEGGNPDYHDEYDGFM